MTDIRAEYAKSARGGCKRCKSKFSKGELKIVMESTGDSHYSTSYHLNCWSIPKAFSAENFEYADCTDEDKATIAAYLDDDENRAGKKNRASKKKYKRAKLKTMARGVSMTTPLVWMPLLSK